MATTVGNVHGSDLETGSGYNSDTEEDQRWNMTSGMVCAPTHTGMGWFRYTREGPWSATIGCMDWQRNQWEASFKDVPFAVENDTRSGGRRVHVHEFPSRETWVNEDLGRLRQQITVEGYVYGDKSDLWAEMLFAALTQPLDKTNTTGAGMLYLPMRVPMWAVCQSVESSFDAQMLGRMNFTMQFSVEPRNYGVKNVPSTHLSLVMLSNGVRDATQNNIATAIRRFDNLFTGTQPSVARQTAANMIRSTGNLLRNAASKVRLNQIGGSIVEFVAGRFIDNPADYADMQRTSINTMNRNAAVLSQRASSLSFYQQALGGLAIRASTGEVLPATGDMGEGFAGMLWNALSTLKTGSPRTSENASDLAQALIPMTNLRPNTAALSASQLATASVQAEVQLAETVAQLVRRMALSYSIQAAMEVAPSKQPDASLTRTRLLEQIDEETEALTGFGGQQEVMRDVRSSVVKFVDYYSAGGKASVEIPAAYAGKPLAVLAATLYGSNAEGRDLDLMRFNGVSHPMFAPTAMVALKDGSMILSSGI